MPTFTWQAPTGIKNGPYPTDSCFGRIFNSANHYDIDVYYELDPKHRPNPEHGYGTSKAKKEDVFAHVALLNRAGFNVSVSVVTGRACVARQRRDIEDDQRQNYCFHIGAMSNSLIMTKFLLNGIRWSADIPKCVKAFKLLVEESGANEPYEVFNCFLIAAQAAYKTNQHNLAVQVCQAIKPFTKTEYEALLKSTSTSTMSCTYRVVTARSEKNCRELKDATIPWLTKKGAYAKYLTLIEEIENEAATERKTFVTNLSDALGNFGQLRLGLVPAG